MKPPVWPFLQRHNKTWREGEYDDSEELQSILAADPEYLSGAVRFVGTRVPVQALSDTLDGGGTVEEFLDGWPNVPREAPRRLFTGSKTRPVRLLCLN